MGRHFGVRLETAEARAEVRWEMDVRHWTQQDWADAAGISRPTISVWIQGQPIEIKSLKLLMKALHDNPPDPFLARILWSDRPVRIKNAKAADEANAAMADGE